MRNFFFACVVILVFSACDINDLTAVKQDIQGESARRKWTFIVYMAADNDLESAAIADLNELEAVQYGNAPISILVLLDRSPGYDMTNGNWSDTRLFEVKSDPNGLTSTIISTRLDCQELGLTKDTETELNTADPLVLSKLIDFAKRAYPAEQYALFIWGHGTGWRGGSNTESPPVPLKAIAFDDTHGQYMSLPSFGRAIAGKGLSFIGFDTCYAALLEVAYQIRNDAILFAGSEGEILSTGWDYTALFNGFLQKPNLSIADLGDSIQSQFSAQYAGLSNATISRIQLSQVNNLFVKFNDFAGTVVDAIAAAAAELASALTAAIPSSWAKNGTSKKIGVHVIPLQGMAVPAALHELAYVRGSMAIDKSAFVENSLHWVPNAVPQSSSLLDKLFYWTYP